MGVSTMVDPAAGGGRGHGVEIKTSALSRAEGLHYGNATSVRMNGWIFRVPAPVTCRKHSSRRSSAPRRRRLARRSRW